MAAVRISIPSEIVGLAFYCPLSSIRRNYRCPTLLKLNSNSVETVRFIRKNRYLFAEASASNILTICHLICVSYLTCKPSAHRMWSELFSPEPMMGLSFPAEE